MIDQALKFIVGELNNYLSSGGLPLEQAVALASVAVPEGGAPAGAAQQLVLSLVNIEREAAIGAPAFLAQAGGGGYARTQQALHLNLYVLLSAPLAGGYADALKALSAAMSFLQGKPNYDSQNSSSFPANLSQLSMEFVSLSLAELSTLWAILGANYLPSAVYKLRMISLNADWTIAPVRAIDHIAPTVGSGA
jgi:hypothetical protein